MCLVAKHLSGLWRSAQDSSGEPSGDVPNPRRKGRAGFGYMLGPPARCPFSPLCWGRVPLLK